MMRRLLPLFALLLAACQGYDPMPLDDDAHLQAWAARSPTDAAVVEYARRLAERDTQPRGAYNPADGISLPEAEVIALFFNPDLRVARLHADAELAGARESGRWEDPELEVDAMWIIDSIANPWILGGAIKFTIPFSGRHGVEEDLAYAEYDVAVRRVIEQEWNTLTELRQAWQEHAAAAERTRLTREFIAEVEDVKTVADRLDEAGELTSLDSRLFALELATRRGELISLQAETARLDLKARELMGLRPDAPLMLQTALARGDVRPYNRQTLISGWPTLAVKRAEYETAEHRLRLEIHKQYPDLTIGPGYELEEGQSRIGIGFGLPIPIINTNREGIARAKAARLAMRAEYEGELERLLHRVAQAEQQLNSAKDQRAYVERELAPLVDEQVIDARRFAELGEFDALVQLDALSRRHEARLLVLESVLRQALAREELTALLGPTFKPEPKEDQDE
jgi:cobalt-zinc-cadmium efflux system outer membrane protein